MLLLMMCRRFCQKYYPICDTCDTNDGKDLQYHNDQNPQSSTEVFGGRKASWTDISSRRFGLHPKSSSMTTTFRGPLHLRNPCHISSSPNFCSCFQVCFYDIHYQDLQGVRQIPVTRMCEASLKKGAGLPLCQCHIRPHRPMAYPDTNIDDQRHPR